VRAWVCVCAHVGGACVWCVHVYVCVHAAAAHLLRSWVRIPPGAWVFVVSVVYCQVEVSATSIHSSRGVLPTVVHRRV